VTHDQEEAMDMADIVAVMNKGQIEQMGAPEKLYDRPKTAFVAKFLGQSNIFVGEVAETNSEAVSINFKGNKLTAPVARSEKTTGKIAIGVRPEKTQFHAAKPDATSTTNVLGPGEITDIRFTGVSNQYLIEIPDVGEIIVFAQNVGKSPVVELGAQVWVSWQVEHSFGLADLPTGKEDA
jgi:spermidine/putrescine transport system ATP-binding protein